MSDLFKYAKALVSKAGMSFISCEVFGKILTSNDDSGRHGVLIPTGAYSFFPDFVIPDSKENATLEFSGFNSTSENHQLFAYKYYERYPERRITRLPKIINAIDTSPRILVCLRAKHSDGSFGYYFDCGTSGPEGRFENLFHMIFGTEVSITPGYFVIRQVDSENFTVDSALGELLVKFDEIKDSGWIDSMRTGDTGIGYTFETLLGIKENNDKHADFQGIEIKCKGRKEGDISNNGKINLFQAGPDWLQEASAKDRIRLLGNANPENGLYTCYSAVTVAPNNLGLVLEIIHANEKIDLCKSSEAVGYWSFEKLAIRLAEKHSRAAFVNARVRNTKTKSQFAYEEMVYCDQPSIERFVSLVADRSIVFEFTMKEKPNGSIRNHGYPWRLIRAEFLNQLFAFQIKLR